jgi:hypothetical protein
MEANPSWRTAWLRRIAPAGLLRRRRRYELELVTNTGERLRRVTRSPVTDLDSHIGVGDAWAVIHAADASWNGEVGEWVTLDPSSSDEPPAP